ncbi:MAG: PKD domain-containing protein [Flavobacteriales bacterium]|nr:PKD domain-containing protein [Bacteroidota bacterium]MCB9240603.1 PKD domain-containing protein [Flavobacteriales bacterium]
MLLALATFFMLTVTAVSAQSNCVKADFEFAIDQSTKTVKFKAETSSNALAVFWEFDSSKVRGFTATHTYASAGTYKVCMTAYAFNTATKQRCSTTVCKTITIRDCDLKADFEVHTDGLGVKLEAKSNSKHAVYGWTFGDGDDARGQTAGHRYQKEGKYTICLFVKDTVTGCSTRLCKDVALRECNLKVAFKFEQRGNDVKFKAESNEQNVTYVWSFGDGSDGRGQEIKHSYAKPGTYRVCVTAILTNSSGTQKCTTTVCEKVEIERQKDTCDLRADFKYEIDGRKIRVKGEASEKGVLFFWSWGDGGSDHGVTANHKYAKEGVYEVCMIAFNPKTKCKVMVCKRVVIEKPCKLKADFKYRIDGLKIVLKARSNGSSDVVYGWKISDSSAYRGRVVRHQFSSAGVYKVTLIAYDKRTGCTVEVTKRIIINKKALEIPQAATDDVMLQTEDLLNAENTRAVEINWNASATPVPAQTNVAFTSDDKVLSHVTIYNLNGNKLVDTDLNVEQNEQVDITLLPTGLYYAHVTAVDGTVQIVKFVKN